MKKTLIAPILVAFGLAACDTSEPYLVLSDTKTLEDIATLAWPSWAIADCGKHDRLVALNALSDHLGVEFKAIQNDFARRRTIEKGVSHAHYFVVKNQRLTVSCRDGKNMTYGELNSLLEEAK